MRRWFLTLAAASLMAAPVVMSGCAARTRFYDADRRDYQQWNRSDQVFYVQWENDTHRRHRDFRDRSSREREEYWEWRHNRENRRDRDRDRDRDHDRDHY